MGKLNDPTTPAPAYEDLFHNPPVNQHPAPSSSSAYIPLNEADDEAYMHDHDPLSQPQQDQSQAEPLLPSSNLATHTHCETCERRREKEQRSRHSLQCCRMVAATFMVLFVCALLVGIVAIESVHGR